MESSGAGSIVLGALTLGLALASTPGPVQGLLVVESIRGGVPRGLIGVVAAAVPMLAGLSLLAVGASIATPDGNALRLLQVAGGLVVLWMAVDAYRSAGTAFLAAREDLERGGRNTLPGWVQIALAVVVFPGTWLFFATVATPLVSSARSAGGPGFALAVAWTNVAGISFMNVIVVLLASWGRRAMSRRVLTTARRVLAVGLSMVGLAMVAFGAIGPAS